ncbi:cytochrome P450 [Poronia punctata]|nr:cytochrome P450 [Poronia punctata]
MARGKDRTAETLAGLQVAVTLAAVHTTLLRMVNVLHDITSSSQPELLAKLRSEIENLKAEFPDWPPHVYDKMHLMDSVLRESQRMSPSTMVGMKRIFKTSHTFSNGLHLAKGTYVCIPTFFIENDPDLIPDPEHFDGFRSYRAFRHDQAKEFRFSSPDYLALGFGFGRAACPGRFFATLVLKMVFAKLLTEFDFRSQGRPPRFSLYEFNLYSTDQEMWIRRRMTTDDAVNKGSVVNI